MLEGGNVGRQRLYKTLVKKNGLVHDEKSGTTLGVIKGKETKEEEKRCFYYITS
jgi:hypothetical protein